MSLKLAGTWNNYAVVAAKCYGASGNVLITQVTNVPDNFAGVITIMIGINDVNGTSPLDGVPTVLAKTLPQARKKGLSLYGGFRKNRC